MNRLRSIELQINTYILGLQRFLMAAMIVLLAACGGGDVGDDPRRVPLEVTAKAAPVYDRDDLYRFFSIAFGAAPGVTYMGQLVEAADYGLSIKQIVNIFTTKPQFLETYPTSLSNREYAQRLVDNVVGTSAPAAAKSEAVEEIVAALSLPEWTRGDITYAIFNNLAKKPADDVKWAGTAMKMANQVEYAKHFTEVMKYDSTDLNYLRTVIFKVSENSTTSGDLTSRIRQILSQGTIIKAPGMVIGLSLGKQIILENSTSGQFTISKNGEFEFNDIKPQSIQTALKISQQPVGQSCQIAANGDKSEIRCTNIGVTNRFNTQSLGVRSVALGTDGSIIAFGSAESALRDLDVAVMKYTANGEPDRSFGNEGIVITNVFGRVASTDGVRAGAIQKDGKILVSGNTKKYGAQETGLFILRYNPDGSLDTTFGNSGVITSFGGVKDKSAHTLIVQANGKIVVGGSINCINRFTSGYCTLIERYNGDGSLDTEFSHPTDDNTKGVAGLAIQQDGKILITGSKEIDGAEELSVARYTASGLPDKSFGTNGLTTVLIGTEIGSQNGGIDIAVDRDGGIYITGWAKSRAENSHISLSKLLPTGAIDRSFGKLGSVVTYVSTPPESDYSNSIAIQEDGKILVAGEATFKRTNSLPYPGFYSAANVDMAVIRYEKTGKLDQTFGRDGILTLDINFFEDRCMDLTLDSTGRIILGGSSFVYDPLDKAGGATHMALVRLLSNGSIDTSFTSTK